ncbi:hypothetical protein GOV05_00790 [Candidatus Woesearchaeota archaeon]|nr:hypothetical protein [Candidatus Woesearchaeota archaeon]
MDEHQRDEGIVTVSVITVLSLFFAFFGLLSVLRLSGSPTIPLIDNMPLEVMAWPVSIGSLLGGLYMFYKRIFKIPWRLRRAVHHTSRFRR